METLTDIKISLVERFHWSLYEINKTDVVDLFRFVGRLTRAGGTGASAPRRMYCDQVDFL